MTTERFRIVYRLPKIFGFDKDHSFSARWHYPFEFIGVDRDTSDREQELNLRYDKFYELRKGKKIYSEPVIKHILSPMFARKPGPHRKPIEYKFRDIMNKANDVPFIHTLKPYAYLPVKLETFLEWKLERYNTFYLVRKEWKRLSKPFVGHLVREYGYDIR